MSGKEVGAHVWTDTWRWAALPTVNHVVVTICPQPNLPFSSRLQLALVLERSLLL